MPSSKLLIAGLSISVFAHTSQTERLGGVQLRAALWVGIIPILTKVCF